MSVADDPAYKYGLLLGALDGLIENWEVAQSRYPITDAAGAILSAAVSDLRQVVRIHG